MSDLWDEDDDLELEEEPQQTGSTHRARRSRAAGESRGNWYLLTGLLIGLALGLLIAWVISPVDYVDTGPDSLARPYKDEYRRVIALAYLVEGDLEWARARMNLVDANGTVQELAAQAQRMLAENQPANEARALAMLASNLARPVVKITASPQVAAQKATQPEPTEDLSTDIPATATAPEVSAAIQTPTNPPPTRTPTVTLTPIPSFTPRPTATPVRVSDAPFELKEKQEVCGGSTYEGLIRIQVNSKDGVPMPGVKIIITWQEFEEVFYTGLAPEINPGYADFLMSPGITYNLRVG